MKKIISIIAIIVFANAAFSDIEVKRYNENYIFRFVEGDLVRCWVMPDFVDLNYFNTEWTTVTQTAVDRSWPVAQGALAAECSSGHIYRTTTNFFYDIMLGEVRNDLPIGVPCGESLSSVNFRLVTFNGRKGIGICF